jgi:hypothetical protein
MEFKQSDTVAILRSYKFQYRKINSCAQRCNFHDNNTQTPLPPLSRLRFQGLPLIPLHWRTNYFIQCLYMLPQHAASCQAKCPRSCNDLRYFGLEIVSTFLKYKWRKWNLIFHSMQSWVLFFGQCAF